jgi:hypothetical protein
VNSVRQEMLDCLEDPGHIYFADQIQEWADRLDGRDWKKIAIEAIAALQECCGCSITGYDASTYLAEHLTGEEHNDLVVAWQLAGRR